MLPEMLWGSPERLWAAVGVSGGSMFPAMLEMISPAPPAAITSPNTSNTKAEPYRPAASTRSGGALVGDRPARLTTSITLPSALAFFD